MIPPSNSSFQYSVCCGGCIHVIYATFILLPSIVPYSVSFHYHWAELEQYLPLDQSTQTSDLRLSHFLVLSHRACFQLQMNNPPCFLAPFLLLCCSPSFSFQGVLLFYFTFLFLLSWWPYNVCLQSTGNHNVCFGWWIHVCQAARHSSTVNEILVVGLLHKCGTSKGVKTLADSYSRSAPLPRVIALIALIAHVSHATDVITRFPPLTPVPLHIIY